MLLSRCAICESIKSRLIKEQEASISSLAIKTPLSKIPSFGNIFFNYFDWIIVMSILI